MNNEISSDGGERIEIQAGEIVDMAIEETVIVTVDLLAIIEVQAAVRFDADFGT